MPTGPEKPPLVTPWFFDLEPEERAVSAAGFLGHAPVTAFGQADVWSCGAEVAGPRTGRFTGAHFAPMHRDKVTALAQLLRQHRGRATGGGAVRALVQFAAAAFGFFVVARAHTGCYSVVVRGNASFFLQLTSVLLQLTSTVKIIRDKVSARIIY